eukprot:gene13772-9862_t
MIRSIINKAVRAVLDELFLDAPSVNLSMGADLFSDSKINLSNLRFRPDIFDISLQPFSLVAGHLGSLNVEGIAEVALGGQLKFQAENIFLLFRLDSIADPEKVQTMKKILIELQSGKFSAVLLADVLRKLQGLSLPPDIDVKEKRKMDPAWLMAVKGFQLYVDYNRSSYGAKSFDRTVELFKANWRSEVHTVMVSPLDVDVVIGVHIKRSSGLICPHIAVSMPTVKVSVDERQMRTLRSMVLQLAQAKKKFQQHVKIQKIFRKGFPLPKMYEVGGIRFLPHLTLRGQPYPSKIDIPVGTSGQPSLVAFMKDRVGSQWKVMMWKFAIRSVMHDLQMTRPLGRWVEIIRLLFIRRDYAFTYAKLLKRSPDTGNYIFNVNSNAVNANAMRQLFEYEMMLPLPAVHMFRTLAYLIAMVGAQHMKRRSFATSTKPTPTAASDSMMTPPWEKLCLTWRDILLVYTELYETQRESAFHRFDRSGQDDDVDDYFFVAGDDALSTRSAGGGGGGDDFQSVASSGSSGHEHAAAEKSRRAGGAAPSFMKKFDLSAFGDALGGIVEKVDRAKGDGSDSTALFSSQVEAVIKGATPLPQTKHPSLDRIAEAVQWAVNKHKSPVTVMPPDVSLKIEKCVVEVKTPSTLQQKERLPLLNAAVEGVHVTVNISQSSSAAASKGATAGETASSASRQVRGFSTLTGALVQFRLVTRQFSLALAVPVARSTPPPSAPAPPAPPVPLVSTTAAEGGGEMKRSVSNLTLSSDEGDSEVSSVTTSTVGGIGAATATTAAAVAATATASATMKTPEKPQRPPLGLQRPAAGAAAAADTATGGGGLGTPPRTGHPQPLHRGPYTIHTPIDDTLGVVRSAVLDAQPATRSGGGGGGGGRKELREVISSAPAENVFVFCVILDLDDRGEGAGDVQVQLGGMRMDFSRRTLTALYDPLIAETFRQLWTDYAVLSTWLPFVSSSERSLLVDWDEAVPYVVLACDPPVAVLDRLAMQADVARRRQSSQEFMTATATATATSASASASERISRKSSPAAAAAAADEAAAMKAVLIDDLSHIAHDLEHQNAIVFNKNLMHWLGTMEAALPRVLSVCVRTSPVVLQSLEAVVVRDLVYAKIHAVLDQAAQRRRTPTTTTFFGASATASSMFSMDSVWGILGHLVLATAENARDSRPRGYSTFTGVRKWGAKRNGGGGGGGGGGSGQGATGSARLRDDSAASTLTATATSLSSFKIKALIPAVEIVVAKALVPYPALDVHVQGMAVLKIPMSDETLCHYLAWLLAEYCPVHTL